LIWYQEVVERHHDGQVVVMVVAWQRGTREVANDRRKRSPEKEKENARNTNALMKGTLLV